MAKRKTKSAGYIVYSWWYGVHDFFQVRKNAEHEAKMTSSAGRCQTLVYEMTTPDTPRNYADWSYRAKQQSGQNVLVAVYESGKELYRLEDR